MLRRGRTTTLVLVSAGLLLGGCTSVVEGVATPEATAAPTPGDDPMFEAPAIGTCHQVEVVYDPLDVPPVVDCAEPHTAETAAVLDTGLPLDAPYPTEEDLDYAEDSPFTDVCSYSTADEYVGAEPGDLTYVDYTVLLPTPEQWAAGARWVACDVVYGGSGPEPAPGRMANALDGPDASAYRSCLDGSPVAYDEVPCSVEHWAEQLNSLPDVPEGAPFPVDRAARQPYADQCLPDAVDYLDGPLPSEYVLDVTTDDEEYWADSPFPQCVIARADGGTSTSSVRG